MRRTLWVLVGVSFTFTTVSFAKEAPVDVNRQVEQVVAAHADEVRACFDEASAWSPPFEGFVSWDFVLTAKGTVGDGCIGESAFTPALNPTVEDRLGRCLGGLLRAWHFTPPASGHDVEVSYRFHTTHAPAK